MKAKYQLHSNFIVFINTLLIAVAAIAVSACSSDMQKQNTASEEISYQNNDNDRRDEFICIGYTDVNSLDPFNDTSEYYSSVFSPVFDKLLEIDENGNISGGLIEAWSESQDGLSYSFKLKHGVRFSNGRAFTTESLKTAWDYAREEYKLSGSGKWSVIDSIECSDELNMTVRLRKCDPQFILNVADSAYVEPETFNRVGAERYWNNPIGCGRYTYAVRYPGKSISFYRNENYWGDNSDNPKILTYKIVADGEARSEQFIDDTADMILNVPYEYIGEVRSDVDVTMLRTAGTTELWLGTQCKTSSPCEDVNLRRAISLCIDRSLIAVNIYGNGYPIYTTVPESVFEGYGYGSGEFYRHDIKLAREYLSKSSYDGETLRLIVPTAKFERVDEVVQTLNAMLSDIGIDVEIQMLEGAAFTAARGNGEYDLCIQSHRFRACDIKWMWQQFVYNHGKYHYSSREALDLITAAYHSSDIGTCSDYMNKALTIIAEDCGPIIPISVFETNGAYRSEWSGIRIYSDGQFDLSNVKKKQI